MCKSIEVDPDELDSYYNLSDEPLYRLCTALKNSSTDNTVIPLELAGKVLMEKVTEKVLDENANVEKEIEKEIEKETTYTISKAALQIQELNSDNLKLNVFLDENKYEVNKEAIKNIQSTAIYY